MLFAPSGTLLEACVLALLNREDLYGYMLTQNMQSVANLSESTLYPILKRLEANGYVTTDTQEHGGWKSRAFCACTTSRFRAATGAITPSRPRAARNLRRTAQNGTNIKNGYPI